jgi:hypothetical protein
MRGSPTPDGRCTVRVPPSGSASPGALGGRDTRGIARLLFGAAAAATLATGLWDLTFRCAIAHQSGNTGTLNAASLAIVVTHTPIGYVCLPAAADLAGPRFDCTRNGVRYPIRTVVEATAPLRVGASCTLVGAPA